MTSLINVLGLIDDVQLLTARHFSQRKSLVVNNAATNIAYHEVAFPDYDMPGVRAIIVQFFDSQQLKQIHEEQAQKCVI